MSASTKSPARPMSILRRIAIEGCLLLVAILEWDYRRLRRSQLANLRQRNAVVNLLSDLTHYEKKE